MSSDKTPDYYEILGVSKTATPEELKKAYRQKAREWHPDTKSTPEEKVAATQKFQVINEAYEVLSDPQKRAEYDQLGAVPNYTPSNKWQNTSAHTYENEVDFEQFIKNIMDELFKHVEQEIADNADAAWRQAEKIHAEEEAKWENIFQQRQQEEKDWFTTEMAEDFTAPQREAANPPPSPSVEATTPRLSFKKLFSRAAAVASAVAVMFGGYKGADTLSHAGRHQGLDGSVRPEEVKFHIKSSSPEELVALAKQSPQNRQEANRLVQSEINSTKPVLENLHSNEHLENLMSFGGTAFGEKNFLTVNLPHDFTLSVINKTFQQKFNTLESASSYISSETNKEYEKLDALGQRTPGTTKKEITQIAQHPVGYKVYIREIMALEENLNDLQAKEKALKEDAVSPTNEQREKDETEPQGFQKFFQHFSKVARNTVFPLIGSQPSTGYSQDMLTVHWNTQQHTGR